MAAPLACRGTHDLVVVSMSIGHTDALAAVLRPLWQRHLPDRRAGLPLPRHVREVMAVFDALVRASGPASEHDTPPDTVDSVAAVLSGGPLVLSVADAAVRLGVGEREVRKLRQRRRWRSPRRGFLFLVDIEQELRERRS